MLHNCMSVSPPFLHIDVDWVIMEFVFKLAEQKEEGVEDVTVDEWRQSGVSLFGVCSLFSKRARPPPRPLISASKGKGAPAASLSKTDTFPASAPFQSASRSLSPTSPSSPAPVQHSTMIMVHPASFSSLDLLLDVNDMQVRTVPSKFELLPPLPSISFASIRTLGRARE